MLDDLPGASARLKLTCASEGWGVWTDELHRIVGICAAFDFDGHVDESVRLRQLIARHGLEADAQRIDDFIHRGKRDPSTRDWRWFEAWDMVPKPAHWGKQACFEVRLLR